MLLLIEIHQNCVSQTLILLCIAIFSNQSRDCQIKMAASITVILKHFKACIFQTIGPIFMKFLPSIMVCKKLLAYVTLIFCVFPFKTGLKIFHAIEQIHFTLDLSIHYHIPTDHYVYYHMTSRLGVILYHVIKLITTSGLQILLT